MPRRRTIDGACSDTYLLDIKYCQLYLTSLWCHDSLKALLTWWLSQLGGTDGPARWAPDIMPCFPTAGKNPTLTLSVDNPENWISSLFFGINSRGRESKWPNANGMWSLLERILGFSRLGEPKSWLVQCKFSEPTFLINTYIDTG